MVDEKKPTAKQDGEEASASDQKPSKEESGSLEKTHSEHQGKLILDATVAPQQIRFPTDISLLNEAREISDQIIDRLYPHSHLEKKPRSYRQRARKDYLALVKQR